MMSLITESSRKLASVKVFWIRWTWLVCSRTSCLRARISVRRSWKASSGTKLRALCCIGQVLFALDRRYLINEKGALAEAAEFSRTLPGLMERTGRIWAAIGRSEFAIALSDLRALD